LFEPAPTNMATACASCSETLCQGKQFGAFCKAEGYETYTCQPAISNCSPRECECWAGPLP
jgi:hypothetical protein